MSLFRGRAGVLACVMAATGSIATAQSNRTSAMGASAAAPAASSSVVTRDDQGHVTVRATRVSEPVVVDGRLDEALYTSVPSFGDFLQQEPHEGEPATEKTDVWLMFDDKNMYVSARCWDSHPERDVANDMRRDGQGISDNENFAVQFDTFFDHRNAFIFNVGLAGGMVDAYMTDERDYNRDWNTVWDAKVAKFDGGWTIEIVVPFKSLRYKTGDGQAWGVNFRRVVRWKNESSFLTRIPASLGRRGLNKVSSGAMLVGVVPPSGRTFELKPYGIQDTSTDRTKTPQISNDVGGDFGIDAKVGVTQGLTADISYNTDFAQVEVDEQQVNLTRFSVQFPEKRDFFLEGQGIFAFGGIQGTGRAGVGPGGSANANPTPNDIPVVFFSRRIGLTEAGTSIQKVPIDAGVRVTGKVGPYSIGLLDVRTGRESTFGLRATNFSTIRIKRDIMRRSSIGGIVTDRSIASTASVASQTFGADASFGLLDNVSINAYVAKVRTPGVDADDLSYRAAFDYNGDRYGAQLEHLFVDDHFRPEVGFLRRGAFRRDSAFLRFSPRPKSIKAVRKLAWDGSFDYITNSGGQLESRLAQAAFRAELQNGDSLSVEGTHSYEFLARPFQIVKGVSIPVGGYTFPGVRLQYGFGPQRKMSGVVKVEQGDFYDGTRTELSVRGGRVELTSQLSVEPGVTIDWIDLSAASFTTKLVSARTTYTITPRMAASALMQYVSNSHSISTNIRWRWEYVPGSDLFVVYTDDRDTQRSGFPALQSRSLVVKLTRLFRL